VIDQDIRRAHELFVTEGRLPPGLEAQVRPQILRSWKRSKLSGVDPGRPGLSFNGDVDPASKLRLAASAVFERLPRELDGYCMAVYLADSQGTTIHRWVEEPEMRRRLDCIQSEVGMSSCEEFVGTNGGGTAMEDRNAVLVRGPEHYAEALQVFTCASSPIFRPATRQIAGALTLTCRDVDANNLLLPLVVQAAAEIGERLFLDRTLQERLLLKEFVTAGRRFNGAVVAITETMVMTNPKAARLIEGTDQSFLWEHSARTVHQGSFGATVLQLASTEVLARCVPVTDGERVFGVVLELEPIVTPTPSGSRWRSREGRFLTELAGHSPAWMRADLAARQAANTPTRVLVRGEVGTGKRTIARAIDRSLEGHHELEDFDAGAIALDGIVDWSTRLRQTLLDSAAPVLIAHIERLNAESAGVVASLLDRVGDDDRPIYATLTTSSGGVEPWLQALVDRLGRALVEPPPLRDRVEDLPDLVASITRRIAGNGTAVTWSPNAVQALCRLTWPGNLRELESLVRRVLSQRTVGVVTVDDLPDDVRSRAHRHSLTQMERAEVEVIVSALAEAGGNKAEAAAALGISRSTLYRKLRGYGLDLDRSVY
jgi:transcriptional regulator of acetoin/glycerol metabolism